MRNKQGQKRISFPRKLEIVGPVTPSIDSFVLPAFPFFNRLNSGFGVWSTDHDGI
ncbi:unnamed protein product [Penicillium camemberti]|uniref:Str. FM013 n=1 Tax=Penicillium camemberti (strain FM 013) TaxID=1429867 RepID=A0A0G4NT85_PENC3|nr:unnamed protein product [Penicillium camemberti]